MKTYRDPKTGKFCKKEGSSVTTAIVRDPKTGRFIKLNSKEAVNSNEISELKPKKIKEDVSSTELAELKNKIIDLEKTVQELGNKLSSMYNQESIIPDYDHEVNSDDKFKVLPYPTWIFLKHYDNIVDIHIGEKYFNRGRIYHNFTTWSREGAWWERGPVSTFLIPANTEFSITNGYCKGEVDKNAIVRCRCKGFNEKKL